jgi:hypothetical protein
LVACSRKALEKPYAETAARETRTDEVASHERTYRAARHPAAAVAFSA